MVERKKINLFDRLVAILLIIAVGISSIVIAGFFSLMLVFVISGAAILFTLTKLTDLVTKKKKAKEDGIIETTRRIID